MYMISFSLGHLVIERQSADPSPMADNLMQWVKKFKLVISAPLEIIKMLPHSLNLPLKGLAMDASRSA